MKATKRRRPTTKPTRAVRIVHALPGGAVIRLQADKVIRHYVCLNAHEGHTGEKLLVRMDDEAIVYSVRPGQCSYLGDRARRPCKHRAALSALASQGKIDF